MQSTIRDRWMSITLPTAWLGAFALALTTGCFGSDGDDVAISFESEPIESATVSTGRVDADIRVESEEPESTRVRVWLRESELFFSKPLVLSAGESLHAELRGVSQWLDPDPSSSQPDYTTRFEGLPAEGPLRVVFSRASGAVVDFAVELRPGFEVLEPTPDAVVDADEPLLLTWDPAEPDDVMRLRLQVSCSTFEGEERGQVRRRSTLDDGFVFFDLRASFTILEDPEVEECELDVDFERLSETDVSPPYAVTSSMRATQARSVEGLPLRF